MGFRRSAVQICPPRPSASTKAVATYLSVRRACLFLFIVNVIIDYRPEILYYHPTLLNIDIAGRREDNKPKSNPTHNLI